MSDRSTTERPATRVEISDMLGDLDDDGPAGSGHLRCQNEQWRRLRPRVPVALKPGGPLPAQAGEEWGLTPLLVLAQFDLVRRNALKFA